MEASSCISYAAGLLITCSSLLLWFYSPLKITLGQLFLNKNLYSIDQVETAVMLINPWLGKLISCFICCSFWISLIVGFIIMLIQNLPWYFPILTFFTYPSLAYLYKHLIDKK